MRRTIDPAVRGSMRACEEACEDRCEHAKKRSATTMDAEGLNEGIGCMPMIGFVPMDGSDQWIVVGEDRFGERRSMRMKDP